MIRNFALSLILAVAVFAQADDDAVDQNQCDRVQFTLPKGASPDGDMKDAQNRRTYLLQDDDLVQTAISCYEGVSPEGDWPTLNCQFQLERKPCKSRLDEIEGGFYFGLDDYIFQDWAYIQAENLTTETAVITVQDGSAGDGRPDEQDPTEANSTSDKSGWILEDFVDKFEYDAQGFIKGYITVNMRRAFETTQPEYDTQIAVDETDCDTGYFYGGWYWTWDDKDNDITSEAKTDFMPSAACATASICTSERVQFSLPEGASPDGDMTDAKNRRSYDLNDDDLVKSAVSCYEGVSPEGDWPTLNCQFQLERKPCNSRLNEIEGGFFYKLTSDEFDDWAYIQTQDLTTTKPVFVLQDGSAGDGRPDEQDPTEANSASDKSGWILEDFEDGFEYDDFGYVRGYITVNVRRALSTTQPEHDTQIAADETYCDTGYQLGGWYWTWINFEEDIETAYKPDFMPSAACAARQICLDDDECTVTDPDVDSDDEDSDADEEGNVTETTEVNADDSGMTLAAAFGATTAAFALLAF